ncbi:pyridoxamine 5'-phosphate oxidase [Verticillium alfalfae VaMs.102]|uniref:pyridoxal 5'-phosphate synthase n=1 Tax=Verticillium alfalfae (strain VaMs.102 / ATCC MYA-4576 / FGSC 10136) TaxID=526221 RepID=C9S7J7_VERA1|nr:pyridoxamine 5'-phosphate oxidase [Verticillium alfalfae VaMs.102]EEY14758.1 pyridoxamine 5'-phosphate oxidase [Verticillium alfalfae VaMs.102]
MALHPPNDPSKLISQSLQQAPKPTGRRRSSRHQPCTAPTSTRRRRRRSSTPGSRRRRRPPPSRTQRRARWRRRTCPRAACRRARSTSRSSDAAGAYVVYSNFATSRKAADLASNPRASLVFWWEALQRQVRVEGVAARVPREQSQTYYDTRVRGSRLGAWASRQSQVLEAQGDGDDGRAQLEGWVKEAEARFDGEEKIPVPEFWGGLKIVPDRVEFWQGRDSRLHDRFVYEKDGEAWTLNRLSP